MNSIHHRMAAPASRACSTEPTHVRCRAATAGACECEPCGADQLEDINGTAVLTESSADLDEAVVELCLVCPAMV